MLAGGCNCKGVTFIVKDGAQRLSACHCTQCRNQSGHHWASGYSNMENFEITDDASWFAASETARRGSCPACGCFLYWKEVAEEGMRFSLGVIDGPIELELQK